MTATYNPDEIERLVREAREDDARMTPGEWTVDEWGALGHIRVDGASAGISSMGRRPDAAAIARQRNNLRAMADQLEAATAEIGRLQSGRSTSADISDRLLAKIAHNNQRTHALESALREACSMLRGCSSGDGQPLIATSKIDALLAVVNKDLP